MEGSVATSTKSGVFEFAKPLSALLTLVVPATALSCPVFVFDFDLGIRSDHAVIPCASFAISGSLHDEGGGAVVVDGQPGSPPQVFVGANTRRGAETGAEEVGGEAAKTWHLGGFRAQFSGVRPTQWQPFDVASSSFSPRDPASWFSARDSYLGAISTGDVELAMEYGDGDPLAGGRAFGSNSPGPEHPISVPITPAAAEDRAVDVPTPPMFPLMLGGLLLGVGLARRRG